MNSSDRGWVVVASILFVIALLIVAGLLAAPGECVSIYAILAIVTILPALSRSQYKRIWATIATLIVLMLLIRDDQSGRQFRFQATSEHIPEQHSK
jgi:D-alanyl-lipoteichoic acid acyltransferase DltB (MBOAT superfamily)